MDLETDVMDSPGSTGAPGESGADNQPEEQGGGSGARSPSTGTERARSADGRYQGDGKDKGKAAPAPKPEAQKLKIRVKSKTGGEEELDLSPEEIGQRLSLHQEAHHRMRTLAEERKALEKEKAQLQQERDLVEKMADDPAAFLKHVREKVKDPKKAHRLLVLALKNDLAEQQMTPEERELAELRADKAQRDAEAQERAEREEKEKTQRDLQARVEKVRPMLVKQLTGILDLGGLPATEGTLAVAAAAWRDNKRLGVELSEAELAQYVKDELDGQIDARLGDKALTDEVFEEKYPKLMERAHRILVAKIRAKKEKARTGGTREPAAVGRSERSQSEGGVIPPKKPLTRAEERAIYGPDLS